MYKIFKAVSKNTVIAVVLVLMICMAAYLNYAYKKPGENKQAINNNVKTTKQSDKIDNGDKATMAASNYFATQRMDKEKSREKLLNYLKKLIDDKSTKDADREKITNQYALLAGFSDKEKNIERTLTAKGFKDIIVTLSGNTDKDIVANVIVDKVDTQKEVQIEDAVMAEVNISDFSKIRITTYSSGE
jgi:poly-D-alanine transfer protein DltD